MERAKGPMYHGHGYGAENRWMVIYQSDLGAEYIYDSYLTKDQAQTIASQQNSHVMDGSCFVREMSGE